MKKIIWLFDQPGSGRKALIENIKNETNDVKSLLGIDGAKIEIVDLAYDREALQLSYE